MPDVRDVTTIAGYTLAESYERTTSRHEKITRAGNLEMFQWECEFEDAERPELLSQSIVKQSPLCTRNALYGVRTEAFGLHYKARENENVQYVDVMILYLYICKYFMFLVVHPVIQVGDACKDKETCLRKFGLIKCSCDLPQILYHPVIPFRHNNKLVFCQ